MMKKIANNNASIKFIHIPVCDLVIAFKYYPGSIKTLFEMARFYQPSVLILDEFENIFLEGNDKAIDSLLE